MTARGQRSGYTLLEVVIVCAIIVMIVAMAVPSLRSMSSYYKLQGAVDSVRGAWAQARTRAIEEGRPYRFAVEPNGSRFRIAPDQAEYWSDVMGFQDPEGPGLVYQKAIPSGVRFSVNGAPISQAAPEQPLGFGQENPLPADIPPDAWIPVAVFLPQGNARENVRIVFQVQGVRPMVLQLRALTGTVSAQSINQQIP